MEEHNSSLNYREHWVEVPNRITRFFSKKNKNQNEFKEENTLEIDATDFIDYYDSDPTDDEEPYDDTRFEEDEDISYYGFNIVDAPDSDEEKDQLRIDLRSINKQFFSFFVFIFIRKY